jgi:hypothetical protein
MGVLTWVVFLLLGLPMILGGLLAALALRPRTPGTAAHAAEKPPIPQTGMERASGVAPAAQRTRARAVKGGRPGRKAGGPPPSPGRKS